MGQQNLAESKVAEHRKGIERQLPRTTTSTLWSG